MRKVLCQVAWAAPHTRDTYLSALYRRLAARRGKKRAILAVAHSILVMAYFMSSLKQDYVELGGDYFESLNPNSLRRYLVRRLEHLGYEVALQPAAA